MTEKNLEQQELWNRYSIASDKDRKFVDAKVFEEIAGKELANKHRTVQRLISETADGTTLEVDNLVQKFAIPQQRSHLIAAAAGVEQMLSLRRFKEKPWNKKGGAWSSFSFQKQCYPNTIFLVL